MEQRYSRQDRGKMRPQALSVLLMLALLTGCGKNRLRDAAALAKQGADTGTALAAFYNARAEDAQQTLLITTARTRSLLGNAIAGRITAQLLVGRTIDGRTTYLADELKAQRTPLAASLYSRLDRSTQAALAAYDSHQPPYAGLNALLAADINKIIVGSGIYRPDLFKDVKLSAGAEEMVRDNAAAGQDTLFPDAALPVQRLAYLNRFLLDSAFPGLITPDPVEIEAQEQAALRSRANAASALADLCVSLEKLVASGVTTEVRTSVGKLQAAVESANQHPFTIQGLTLPDTPTALLGKLSDFLLQQEQQRQFQRNLPALLPIITTLSDVFDKEKFLYDETAALAVVSDTYAQTDPIVTVDPTVSNADNRNKMEAIEADAYAKIGAERRASEALQTSLHAFRLSVEHFTRPHAAPKAGAQKP